METIWCPIHGQEGSVQCGCRQEIKSDITVQTVAEKTPATAAACQRPPGRPPEMEACERREKILSAACELLGQHGYGAASMDRIAQSSGMSKRTLYQLFPSRKALLHALIHSRLFCFAPQCRKTVSTPDEELIGLLQDMAHKILTVERLGLIRVIISAAGESRDISDIMLNLKSGGETNILHGWLRSYCAMHGHENENIQDLSQHLFGITVGELLLHSLINNPDKDTTEYSQHIDRYVASGARIFLEGLHAIWARGANATNKMPPIV
jgi:TetR/AcrR family transcriptional regulator of autoinduction and epiphytic fitness